MHQASRVTPAARATGYIQIWLSEMVGSHGAATSSACRERHYLLQVFVRGPDSGRYRMETLQRPSPAQRRLSTVTLDLVHVLDSRMEAGRVREDTPREGLVGWSESGEGSIAHTARLGSGDGRERSPQGPSVVITGAACCCAGTDRGLTGAASPGSGTGTGSTTSSSTAIGAGIGTGTDTTASSGTATGTTSTDTRGTGSRSLGTSPSTDGGTG
ncbi:hypothetical protein KI387_043731 [Taxus chinensis]|uniref:Uncharacterized protein n=1 Tax=Taxus chinensis TaxID=29808 RepID=A0AA38LRJ8_TAXCH|nr:hypothetical protein KI387_043731 [Taxus chinensis]